MIAVSTARALVRRLTKPLPPTRSSLGDAVGRVLAETLVAPGPLPRFASAAMDGYALRSRDTRRASPSHPVALRLERGALFAGATRAAGPGPPPRAARRILTGGPVPPGVDAVAPQEEVEVHDGTVFLSSPVRIGSHIRRAGEDCRRGDRIAKAGARVDPALVALLSGLGIDRALVCPAPRVAILVTGSEVRAPGVRRIGAHSLYDSHTGFLASALRSEFGLTPAWAARVPDDAGPLRRGMRRALEEGDLVLITGGVSVGEHDLVRQVASSLGVRTVFWRVAQKPGKPLFFGLRDETVLFGLPGNPGAAVLCYCEYVRLAIRRMLGIPSGPAEVRARLIGSVGPDPLRTRFLRGLRIERAGRSAVRLVRGQGSHLLASLRRSDCFIVLPPTRRGLPRGARVLVHPYPWRLP